jgi:hypothetical protein
MRLRQRVAEVEHLQDACSMALKFAIGKRYQKKLLKYGALMAGMQSPGTVCSLREKKVCDVAKQRLPRCNIRWDSKNQFRYTDRTFPAKHLCGTLRRGKLT